MPRRYPYRRRFARRRIYKLSSLKYENNTICSSFIYPIQSVTNQQILLHASDQAFNTGKRVFSKFRLQVLLSPDHMPEMKGWPLFFALIHYPTGTQPSTGAYELLINSVGTTNNITQPANNIILAGYAIGGKSPTVLYSNSSRTLARGDQIGLRFYTNFTDSHNYSFSVNYSLSYKVSF